MACIACFGEILLRLAPQAGRSLRQADGMDVHVGGAEANVAVALAQLGHQARMVSILPVSDLGDLARRRLSAEGVDLSFLGEAPGRMGLYFHNPPAGLRSGGVTYDRAASAFALSDAAAYDFAGALEGVDHLHLSGISPAVSEAGTRASVALLDAARAQGCSISFDGNFRSKLWQASDRSPREVLAPIVAEADVMFGNYRDAGLLLGKDFGGSNPRRAAEAMFAAFPKLQLIASTQREVSAAGAHRISAWLDRPDGAVESDDVHITDIAERIGTGDAFGAGVLHRWLADKTDDRNALATGLKLMALKHATPGDLPDFIPADLDESGGDLRR